MTIFEKARELGMLINCTEEAEAKDKAQEAFTANEDSVKLMNEYETLQREVENQMQAGEMSEQEFKDMTFKLQKKGMELQVDPFAGPYISAVNNFNRMVNKVFQIIHSTATGEEISGGCCGGDCNCDGGDCDCDSGESCCSSEGGCCGN